jgi:putative heme-binding domain-containing protein
MSSEHPPEDRLRAFGTLVFVERVDLANQIAIHWLNEESDDQDFNEFRRQLLLGWARLDDASVAATLLDQYGDIDPQLRATVIEVLTQRASWTRQLLAAITQTIAGERADNPISKDDLNLNQLRRIEQFDDAALTEQLTAIYGQIREGRNPAREEMIEEMRDFLEETPGDPVRGIAVFNRVCGNCHKMHGEGNEVGPDITRNGRNNWDQLLSNVFDPSLVIGPGYQARQLATTDGRILTGLAVEESQEQVVLKIQGGKLETIPRDQIDEYRVSELSMMPEDLEKLVTPQEMADLFAYLALDLPPDDPEARLLPGAPDH